VDFLQNCWLHFPITNKVHFLSRDSYFQGLDTNFSFSPDSGKNILLVSQR